MGLFYWIKEFFKANQIDIPGYQYYLACNAKRMVRLTFLRKKFVFQLEISTYLLDLIFAIACLRKKLGFHTEYCDHFEYLLLSNFGNRSFLLGHRVVQIERNLVWSFPRVGRLWDKKNFWYSLPRKKVSFPYGNFLLDQGVVQSEPNWYPRLPVLINL